MEKEEVDKNMLMVENIEESEILLGTEIVIRLVSGSEIKGRFLGFKDKGDDFEGRFLLVEQDYYNYIRNMAELLDNGIINLIDFTLKTQKIAFESQKIRKIDESKIHLINNKFYKK